MTGPTRTDRAAGVALAVLGVAVGAEATTFDVAFLTDPVGPKALPLVAAAIFALTGIFVLLRPGPSPAWPTRTVVLRMVAAVAIFAAYALVLGTLGFTLSTTLCVGALSILFGGPVLRSLVAAMLLSVALWYLFTWVLGLPLPLGALWTP
ncbi:MAG: tripartite tricarboxylate transporter TctB family protein [Gemmatimonadota bacterium]